MWTKEHRARHEPRLKDMVSQWAEKKVARWLERADPPRSEAATPTLAVVRAIAWHLRVGGPWRALRSHLPPWRTVYGWFRRWLSLGLFDRLMYEVAVRRRRAAGRVRTPPMAANARRLAELSPEQRRAALSALSPEDLQKLEFTWEFWAREDQLPPPGDWRTWLLLGGRGSGKAVHVDAVIPIPTGWTRLGDISIGDEVFDEAGRICHVMATHDSVPEVAYRLTFSDNSTIDACADHQWVTWTHAERKVFLRSPWEDVSRFPDNWPQWRLSRLHGRQMPRDVVEAALELAGAGMSVRQIERATGAHRNNLAKHLQAGSY